MACRKWWPEAPGARQPGTPGPRATADPWQFADGHALGTSGGGQASGDGENHGKSMRKPWEIYRKSMDVLRFDGGFTMISSIQHVFFMGKHPQVLWWCFLFFCKTHCGTLGL